MIYNETINKYTDTISLSDFFNPFGVASIYLNGK